MKKIFILALACILALAFSGCGYAGNKEYPWSLTKSSMDKKTISTPSQFGFLTVR